MFEMCGKDKKKWDILFLYRKKERKIDNEISLLHPFLVNQIYRVNVRDSPNFCPSKVRRLATEECKFTPDKERIICHTLHIGYANVFNVFVLSFNSR